MIDAVYLVLNIVVGSSAGTLVGGRCNIIIGEGIEPPSPVVSYYLNVDGVTYPNSARWDPAFQGLVKRRAAEVAARYGVRLDTGQFDETYFRPDVCRQDDES